MSYREFEPVELPVAKHPDRLSQTLLRLFERCPRAAFFYLRDDGGTSSHEMFRGSAIHEAIARLTLLCVEQDERTVPGDLAKAVVDEVLADHPEFVLPLRERDRVRSAVYRWAEHSAVDPSTVAAVETKFTVDLGGWVASGIVDRADLSGQTVHVVDYKSTLAFPSQEQFEAGFQLPFYAAAIAFGQPVDGLPLGDGVEWFHLSEVYPQVELRDGGLAVRQRVMSRLEVQETLHDLRALGDQVSVALATGGWPAVAGSHCSQCPSPGECPIPAVLRSHAGSVNTSEEAQEAAEWAERMSDKVSATKKELRRYAASHGPIYFGVDRVMDFNTSMSRGFDVEGLEVAVERAVSYGEPFDLEAFRKERTSTSFKARTVTPDEQDAA